MQNFSIDLAGSYTDNTPFGCGLYWDGCRILYGDRHGIGYIVDDGDVARNTFGAR